MSVSFVVAAYNIQQYIGECLVSLLPCLRPQDELIVINDGSMDKTASIARELIQGHPRAQVFDKINGGLSSARNAGLAHARGKHVLFVDGDDVVVPAIVAEMLRLLDAHDPDILVTDHTEWLPDGQGALRPSRPRSHPANQISRDVCRNLTDTFADGIPCVWARFFRRTLFQGMGAQPFPEWSMYDDMPTTPYLVARARSLYYAPVAMVLYRVRAGSLTRLRSERSCTDMVKGALHAVRAGSTMDAAPELTSSKWNYFVQKFTEAIRQGREVDRPSVAFYKSLVGPLQEANDYLGPLQKHVNSTSLSPGDGAARHARFALRAPNVYAVLQTAIAVHQRRRRQLRAATRE